MVSKKNGGLRIMQDLRKLNAKSQEDKCSMKDMSKCIWGIERANSTLYSTIDLTSGFWQMMLEPHCKEYTPIAIQGIGQLEWVSTPQGLHIKPASFKQLMEAVMLGIPNVMVNVDDQWSWGALGNIRTSFLQTKGLPVKDETCKSASLEARM